MRSTLKKIENVSFTLALAAGMTGFALAQSPASTNQSPASRNSSVQENQNVSNSMVRHAQRELKDNGYYTGRVDGIMGPRTERALRQYQRSENLAQTGRLNRATMKSLGLSDRANIEQNGEASRSAEESPAGQNATTPQAEQSGNVSSDSVRSAQQQLRQDGFYNGPVNGQMNQGTRAALRQYQKQNNLPVTGQVTRDTAQSMGISTSNQNFENNNQRNGLEQLGKGIAEGAKSSNGSRTQHHGNQNENNNH